MDNGISLDELQRRIDNVGRRSPEIVKRATVKATSMLAKEMRRRYKMVLHERSGDLYDSIKPLFNNRTGTRIKFAAGVGTVKGHSQWYKGATHELGAIHEHPGGQPFLIDAAGDIVYVSKKSPAADRLPKTKPHSITIPRRQFVEPTRKAKLQEVRDMIARELSGEITAGVHRG